MFPEREAKFWKHSLSIVLGIILVAQTVYSLWTGWQVYGAEDLSTPFWIWWSWEYVVSVVADTYGVLLVVLLTKWFYEQGSSES
jgi:hypothetical protein